jgi:hypothetical protein
MNGDVALEVTAAAYQGAVDIDIAWHGLPVET